MPEPQEPQAVYYDKDGKPIPDPFAPKASAASSGQIPSQFDLAIGSEFNRETGLPAELAPRGKTVLKMLPIAGSIVGEAVGGAPGAFVGGASGEGLRRLASLATGDETVAQQSPAPNGENPYWSAAKTIIPGMVEQGAVNAIPGVARAASGPVKNIAVDATETLAGKVDPAAARTALQQGRAAFVPRNVSALRAGQARPGLIGQAAGKAADLVEQGFNQVSGPSPAMGAAKVATSFVPQIAYSIANQAGPLGELIRAAILSQLSKGGS